MSELIQNSNNQIDAQLELTESLQVEAYENYQKSITDLAINSLEELNTVALSIADLDLGKGQVQNIIGLLVQLANPICPASLDENPKLKVKVEEIIENLDNFLAQIPETTENTGKIQAAKDTQGQLNLVSLKLLGKTTESKATKDIMDQIDHHSIAA